MSLLSIALTLWALTQIHRGKNRRGLTYAPFALLPLINPPHTIPAALFGILHLIQNRAPIQQRVRAAAWTLAASGAGALVFLAITPQADWQYCGIQNGLWVNILYAVLAYAAYLMAPPSFPHRIVFGVSLFLAATTISSIFSIGGIVYFPFNTTIAKTQFLSLAILGVYAMLGWRDGGALFRFAVISMVILHAWLRITIAFVYDEAPDHVRIAAAVESDPETVRLDAALLARNEFNSTEYIPEPRYCYR